MTCSQHICIHSYYKLCVVCQQHWVGLNAYTCCLATSDQSRAEHGGT